MVMTMLRRGGRGSLLWIEKYECMFEISPCDGVELPEIPTVVGRGSDQRIIMSIRKQDGGTRRTLVRILVNWRQRD